MILFILGIPMAIASTAGIAYKIVEYTNRDTWTGTFDEFRKIYGLAHHNNIDYQEEWDKLASKFMQEGADFTLFKSFRDTKIELKRYYEELYEEKSKSYDQGLQEIADIKRLFQYIDNNSIEIAKQEMRHDEHRKARTMTYARVPGEFHERVVTIPEYKRKQVIGPGLLE